MAGERRRTFPSLVAPRRVTRQRGNVPEAPRGSGTVGSRSAFTYSRVLVPETNRVKLQLIRRWNRFFSSCFNDQLCTRTAAENPRLPRWTKQKTKKNPDSAGPMKTQLSIKGAGTVFLYVGESRQRNICNDDFVLDVWVRPQEQTYRTRVFLFPPRCQSTKERSGSRTRRNGLSPLGSCCFCLIVRCRFECVQKGLLFISSARTTALRSVSQRTGDVTNGGVNPCLVSAQIVWKLHATKNLVTNGKRSWKCSCANVLLTRWRIIFIFLTFYHIFGVLLPLSICIFNAAVMSLCIYYCLWKRTAVTWQNIFSFCFSWICFFMVFFVAIVLSGFCFFFLFYIIIFSGIFLYILGNFLLFMVFFLL